MKTLLLISIVFISVISIGSTRTVVVPKPITPYSSEIVSTKDILIQARDTIGVLKNDIGISNKAKFELSIKLDETSRNLADANTQRELFQIKVNQQTVSLNESSARLVVAKERIVLQTKLAWKWRIISGVLGLAIVVYIASKLYLKGTIPFVG